MTVAAPAYTARILGSPDVPVTIRDDSGRVVLDSSTAPHVTGTVELAIPDAALLDDLDPRDGRRMVVEAGGRVFDLGIRRANPNRETATVTVELASDEALAGDYAQLTDDNTPRTHEASLRAVCNYVLGKIGAALTAGTTDADVTAFWEVTNLASNATVRTVLTGWTAGSGSTGVARDAANTIDGLPTVVFGASGTGVAYLNTPAQGISVRGGEVLTVHAQIASNSTSRPARVMIRFADSTGARIRDAEGPLVNTSTNRAAPTTIAHTMTVPRNATTASVYVSTTVNATGQNHHVNQLMVYTGTPEIIPFFDGTTTGPDYTYAYDGDQYLSGSTRTPLIERDPESLLWTAGVSALAFLRPLVQAAGFRLVCDEQRVWTLRDEFYRTPGNLTFRYGVNIHTGSEELSREDESWFDGAVFVYTWTDQTGTEQSRTDAYALPGATKIIRRDIASAYPGPGRAEYAVRRAQGKGRTVTATRQARWDEAAEQAFSAVLEDTPTQLGIAERVEFDLSRNTVTVTSRTADTPTGAIDLLTGTINALTGTINEL